MKKRVLSVLIALALLCALLPVTGASAAGFSDVSPSDWYYSAVNYAVSNGLMNGVGNNRFAPNDPMTRAMLVTVLWRYDGGWMGYTNGFSDVKNGQWYTDAIAWAAAKGVVGGVGNNRFNPNGNITREQMAAILYRYAQLVGYDTNARGSLNSFPDAGRVSAYARDALSWAVGAGIIGGSDGRLLPQGNATRAQVATILMRFIENYSGTASCDHSWLAATCFAPQTCSKCGRTQGAKLTHSTTNGKCSRCGYQIFEGLAVLYMVTQDYDMGGGCSICFFEDHTYRAVAGGSGIYVNSDGTVSPVTSGGEGSWISEGWWYQSDPAYIDCVETYTEGTCFLLVNSFTDPNLTKYDKAVFGNWKLTEVYDINTDTNYSAAEYGVSSYITFYSDYDVGVEFGSDFFLLTWEFQYVDGDGDYLYYLYEDSDAYTCYYIVSYAELWLFIGNYCFTYVRDT